MNNQKILALLVMILPLGRSILAGAADLENSWIRAQVQGGGGLNLFFKDKSGWQAAGQVRLKGQAADPASLWKISSNGPFLEMSPQPGVEGLVLDAAAELAVVPDPLGDDLIYGDDEKPEAPSWLPADWGFLIPVTGGRALIMASWEPSARDILVQRTKEGSGIRAEITPLPRGRLFISVLSAPGIWIRDDVSKFSITSYKDLGWHPPFLAAWRADLQRRDMPGLTDSWKRKTSRESDWLAFMGHHFPPLVVNRQGAVFRVPRFEDGGTFKKNEDDEDEGIQYQGGIFIYPLAREEDEEEGETPESAWTVLDLVRKTLGDNYRQTLGLGNGVLTDYPYPEGFTWPATCGATGEIEKIFESRKEKQKAGDIKEQFRLMDQFVRYNRKRIEEFRVFTENALKFLESKPLAPAGLQEPLIWAREHYKQELPTMKTPDDCKVLAEKVISLIDSEEKGKVAQVKAQGEAIRTIGGCQDDLLASLRASVKVLRQEAGLIHESEKDPARRALMREIRVMTGPILGLRSPYEGH